MTNTEQTSATEISMDDIELTVTNGEEHEALDEGHYRARLIGFKKDAPKPDWKIQNERVFNQGEGKEDKFIDPEQYAWYWELTEPGYEGIKMNDYTARSFHPKSNGGKYAAKLLGKSKLDGTEEIRSTGGLINRELMLYLTQNKGKNYANANQSSPVRKPAGKAPRKPSLIEPDVPADAPWTVDEDD